MPWSKCPSCDSHTFEVQENSPSGSSYKIMLVQCSRCGTVVGSMDYWACGTLLKQQEEVLNRHSASLENIEYNVTLLGNALNQIISQLRSEK